MSKQLSTKQLVKQILEDIIKNHKRVAKIDMYFPLYKIIEFNGKGNIQRKVSDGRIVITIKSPEIKKG